MTLLCRPEPVAHVIEVGHSKDLLIKESTAIRVSSGDTSTAVDVRLDGKFKAVLLGRDGAVPDRYNFEASSALTVSHCSDHASMLLPRAGNWYVVVMLLPTSSDCDKRVFPVRGVVSVERSTSPQVEPVLQLWELPKLVPPQRSWTALPPGLIALDGPVEVDGCGAVYWTASAWEPESWFDLEAAPGGSRRLIDATFLASPADCATRIRVAGSGLGIPAVAAGPLALLLWGYLRVRAGTRGNPRPGVARGGGASYAAVAPDELDDLDYPEVDCFLEEQEPYLELGALEACRHGPKITQKA